MLGDACKEGVGAGVTRRPRRFRDQIGEFVAGNVLRDVEKLPCRVERRLAATDPRRGLSDAGTHARNRAGALAVVDPGTAPDVVQESHPGGA